MHDERNYHQLPATASQDEESSSLTHRCCSDTKWSSSTDAVAVKRSEDQLLTPVVWDARPTGRALLFPSDPRAAAAPTGCVRSEIDLTATSALGGPWVHNTFFHFPAACASTESHPVPRNPAEHALPVTDWPPAPRDVSSYGSTLSLSEDEWPTPVAWTQEGGNRKQSSSESDSRYATPAHGATAAQALSATYEALEHIGTEDQQTDAMLTMFLQGLVRGETPDSRHIWDPQVQAQDALLNYCKTIIGEPPPPHVPKPNKEDPEELGGTPKAVAEHYWHPTSSPDSFPPFPPAAASLGPPFRVSDPQHDPPKELASMTALYQRPDVHLHQRGRTPGDASSKSPQKEEGVASSDTMTLGGNSHPTACKPCAFHWTKGCANGRDCQFCHEWHAPKKKKPMKDQKNLMIIARPDGKIEFLRCSVDEALRRS